ncbi:hypothetical protein SAMN05421505_109144 [Sinosporangium album]|uniref:PknH-like extracellular domain-containing protein n=1 Tax=Sinosporangium album TaxID=504805 RepID=A0A1G7Y8F6_9ACTN|nr:hypothetical protein [Sinosporangium album]SDG92751.1 hypothetical protein SAMN05421505_109144 [Sinosporangium album]
MSDVHDRSPRPVWPALVVASALTLICAVIAGVAASAAGAELTRGPTTEELRRASAEEVARRWRLWPAGRIFPETLAYTAEQGGEEQADRVGISTDTRCETAVDQALRKPLVRAGCRAVLRATYLDALQGVVVTMGVAVFPDEATALKAKAAVPQTGKASPGLRALAFSGTVSERFTSRVRQAASVRQAGPYVVLTTAGQADGRPAQAVGEQRPGMFAFAPDMAERLLAVLSRPRMPDCAAVEEWRC